MRKRSIVLLAGAAAIAATLVVGPTASASSDRASAGTVVFIHDQEPPNLQGPWVGNNLYATTLVLNNIWYGGQIRDEKANFQPRALHGCTEDRQEEAADDCGRVPQGRQLVGRQARHGARTSGRRGRSSSTRRTTSSAERVARTSSRSAARARRRSVVFKKSYADWETLVSTGVYPAHIIAGQDMNQMFLNSIPVSSGPWIFDSWQKGVQLAS